MNQTRTFLIFAWLMVATLLWMEWSREKNAPATPPPTTTTSAPRDATGAVPDAPRAQPGAVPAAPSTAAAAVSQAAPRDAAAPTRITVTTDALRLTLERGNVVHAALLRYPQTREAGSPPVVLFDDDPARYYAAQSGWVSQAHAAPTHVAGFAPQTAQTAFELTPGEDAVVVPFVWTGPDGVSIRREFTVRRGAYAVDVRDTVINRGAVAWSGHVYRQLVRVPPQVKSGLTNPEAYSFNGALWYGPESGHGRRPFADFLEDGPLQQNNRGGWIALLQHHFFSAWILPPGDETTFELDASEGNRYLIREVGPGVSVAPGQQASTRAQLWVGPKRVDLIKAQNVPGLDRAVDYSRFALLAVLGEGLFWVLSHLHGLFGNWGWSIIGLVLLVKLVLYPLSKAQYTSAAKMRKFQPRLQQLKERYGDDRQKFQLAMMELYKKEKINPVGGCLPVLLQMPVFFALYWVLLESVELRHAPWIGWIQDLTAPDPYFVLPIINIAVMWATQKLTPMVGMDPMQQKIMMFMPLVFGALMIFFPSGLVLYWVTNGALGLLQQWWLIRRYSEPAPAKA